MRRERRRLGAVVLTVALATAGCSSVRDAVVVERPPPRVAMKGYPLDLAYGADPDAPVAMAVPVADLFDTLTGGVFETAFEELVFPTRPAVAPIAPNEPCPEPGPEVVAERPITPDVKTPVDAGAYLFKQEGTLEIAGILKTSIKGLTRRTVRNVRTTTTQTGTQTDFDVELAIGPLRQTQSLRVVPGDGIFLTGLQTSSTGGSNSFDPVLPVEIFSLPTSESTAFTGAGLDPLTGQTLLVQGTVLRKERIAGCDELVDAWQAETTWTFVRPGQAPIVWDYDYAVATQHGGFTVSDHLATTEVIAGLTVTIDVTSTFGSITPTPEPPK